MMLFHFLMTMNVKLSKINLFLRFMFYFFLQFVNKAKFYNSNQKKGIHFEKAYFIIQVFDFSCQLLNLINFELTYFYSIL
jgi:hypothetical protein